METPKGFVVSNKSILLNLWLWWFAFTAIYTELNVLGYPKVEESSLLGHVAGFFGLFVPYGYTSLFSFIWPPTAIFSIISVIIFIGLMVGINKGLNFQGMPIWQRILYNLGALLIVTMVVDLVRLTPFESWKIFINGAFPKYWS